MEYYKITFIFTDELRGRTFKKLTKEIQKENQIKIPMNGGMGSYIKFSII